MVPPKLPAVARDLDSLAASAAAGGGAVCHYLPHPLTLFSMPSGGTALGRVLAGNGMCGTQGWEGRARRGKGSEGKEYSVSELGGNFYLV